MKRIVILYDGTYCLDGFSGAWAAWKKFGSEAEYIGVSHHVPPPRGLKNKEIYMIDFTYPTRIVKKLIRENKRVTSIDHHVSAQKAIKLTKNYSYSLNHSGSVLAWKYFFPEKPLPKILKYVEDMDLWKFRQPHTKEIFAYLDMNFKYNFKHWDKIAKNLENKKKFKDNLKIGKTILRYENKIVKQLSENNAELVKFAGHKILAVNSPILNSQIGYVLIKKLPPVSIIWKKRADHTIYVSLRSNGKVDVSRIAKKFGGGGHKEAAAFMLKPGVKLPWILLETARFRGSSGVQARSRFLMG